MEKLKESFKNLVSKFKDMKLGSKIALVVSVLAVIAALIFFSIYTQSNKYGVLFSGLDPADAKIVTDKLKEKKITTQVKGNSIYVPKDQVDELRLELATEITNGSKGYELLDQGNSFGMTDEEFKVKKQRMLQGEIEKTIKSFPQIANARVHLTLAEDSVFVRDSKPGKAAVYLQLKPSQKLDSEQVKSIVALVAGASQNIPKENVEVIDDKMNLLSKDIFDEQGNYSTSMDKQKQLEKDYEAKLEKSVLDMLEPVIGKDKVKVKVNSDLDFDSRQKTMVTVDPNKVPISESSTKETSNTSGDRLSQSPVDNNMNNTINTNGNQNSGSIKEDNKVNYEVGKTETKVISAPGEVKRLTASVVLDGNLDAKTEESIKNLVSNAIGYKQDRGDEISVVGMTFDSSAKDSAKKVIDDMKAQEDQAKKMQLYKIIGIGSAAFIGLIIAIVIILRSRKSKKEDEEELLGGLDVVIGDTVMPKEKVEFAPIEFEVNDEKAHIEKEIKKYAQEKPEQVADIIKSWIAEDER